MLSYFWPRIHCFPQQARFLHISVSCAQFTMTWMQALSVELMCCVRMCRMNVAITRARRHLVVVGNGKMLSDSPSWKKIIGRAASLPGGRRDAREYQVAEMRFMDARAAFLARDEGRWSRD